jgi:hypothetical protein
MSEPKLVSYNVVPGCMLTEKIADLWYYESGNTFINTIDKKGNRLHPCENVGKHAISHLCSFTHAQVNKIGVKKAVYFTSLWLSKTDWK